MFLNKKKARREAEARERAICACEAELRSLKLGVRFLKTRAQIKERVKTINEQRIKRHIFICQLALLLRRVLEILLKLSGIQMTSRKALRQVKSVRIVRKTLSVASESVWRLNQIPEESHRIFATIGLDLLQFMQNLQLPLPP